ncbi:hypothetical protein PHMEG_00016329 [Phytophthora megakarya]|uniref:Kazal-like domain-containing protein n=1 Tax=Phytophthora megakarya TaxID=4795 RepID=A0A225W174_9STRA|nr:hypothetical protein PHMEG_00016329 [Phytophthora megakarya]
MNFAALILFAAAAIVGTSEAADTITVDPSTLTKINPKNQAPGVETSTSTLSPSAFMGIGPEVFPDETPSPSPSGSASSTGSAGDICQQKCSNEDKPVCGTDGVTYGNLCKLQIAGCTSNKIIWQQSDGPCPK